MAEGTLTLSVDGQIYATTDPPGAGSVWAGGYCFSADGHLHITTTSSSGDYYIGGRRFAPNGAIVVGPGLPLARPYFYNNGFPFDKRDGSLIRQENQTPSASDPYVHGVRVGPLGGVYMITNAAVIPPEIITAPSITIPVYPGVQVVYSVGSANEGATVSAYLWAANGVTVATTQNYTPTLADVAKNLTIRVTWTNTGGSTSSISSPATVSSAVPITVTQTPVYSQYPVVGVSQSYTAGTATSNPAPTKAIQWLSDGVSIGGATSATYTPVAGNAGKILSVRETWSNGYATPVPSTSNGQQVTPAMPTGISYKYIDVTLGADDGGPYVDGAAYTPSFPLSNGSVAPPGNIYATCTSAYASGSGNGHRYYCRKGYFHDPVGGVFFVSIFTRSDTLFSSYGPPGTDLPILDGMAYISGSAGWTPNATTQGAWDYALPGVTANNTALKGRLWVGRSNNGNLTSQRPVGTARRRATSLANLSLINDGTNKGLWYITAGTPSILTVLSNISTAPPDYWGGIGIVFENYTGNPARGIQYRNGASNNRVEYLEVQGTNFKPLAITGWSADGVCNNNTFTNVIVSAFIGNALNLNGTTAARLVTNTYVSNMTAEAQSDIQECEAGTNDWLNLNPWSFGGWVDTTYCYNCNYTGHNAHTAWEMTLITNQPPSNTFIEKTVIIFLTGSTDGRAGGGFINGGYFRNFTITNAPARIQLSGINFDISNGTIIDDGSNTNKDPENQFQVIKFTDTQWPTGTAASNFNIYGVVFDIAGSAVMKTPFWFDGYADGKPPTEIPAVNAVQLNNNRMMLSGNQGLVVWGTSPASRPNPWPNQNIHDNVIVNANLVGQNFSTANSQASTPTYTVQPLNGYMGCVNNTVVPN